MKKFCILFILLLSFSGSFSQQQPAVDFTHLKAEITVSPSEKKVSGNLNFTFDVHGETNSIFIDAEKMNFLDVLLNGKEIKYDTDGSRLWIHSEFEKSTDNVLTLSYTAYPQQAMYFVEAGEPGNYQVWTQGQGKYTSHWLPSFDDTAEKLEFDLEILYPDGAEVAANGELIEKRVVNDTLTSWKYDMQSPMSSYLVAMAAGDFNFYEKETSGGIPLKLYFPERDEERFEPTYRYTGEILDFLEQEIGVPYPWQNYKQLPVRDFLYAGMENTATTIFSDFFLVDSIGFNDRNYVNVNAHELAHQWFGNLVTAASDEHHWLQEGFSTYYALLAEKEIFGEDYFYWKLFQSAEELKEMSDSGKGESLLNPKAGSLTFYQKGAWALHILREKVGEQAFDLAVKNYLEKHRFGNVTTNDFISEVENASGKDLSEFVKDWLEQSAFQGTEALQSLQKSEFIQEYLELASQRQLPLNQKIRLFKRTLSHPVDDILGQEVVRQLSFEISSEATDLLKQAFDSDNLYVRQAIALTLQQIPKELKSRYESLLDDKSYITQETALFTLWQNFPDQRTKYLEKMENADGFLDKNIRTLWLTLSLATPETDAAKRQEYLQELRSYTRPYHRFQLRENAFGYLYQVGAYDLQTLKDLVEATSHHTYSFRSFAKGLLEQIRNSEDLSPEERAYLEQELSASN